jgi:hypothetical protein
VKRLRADSPEALNEKETAVNFPRLILFAMFSEDSLTPMALRRIA